MLSLPLLKKELRSTWLLFAILLVVLTMYVTVVLSMFDPALGSILAEFEAVMPGVMNAFGMTGAGEADLLHYASSYLFGFIMVLFPIVFTVVTANRLVVRYVDSTSMSCLLASPNTRRKIVFTQGLFLWVCTALLIALVAAIGTLYCHFTFPDDLDVGKYILLHVGVLGLHTFIGGIAFFASCVCNEKSRANAISAGIPIAGYVLQMIANVGDKFDYLKYFTFFTLFSPEDLIAGSAGALWGVVALYAGGFLLFFIGGWRFTRRNLPL